MNHADTKWHVALATLAEPRALDRAELIGERAVKMRSLSVSATESSITRGAWFVGKREPMRSGLQQVVEQSVGPAHRWLIRWVQGRWPRGPLTLRLPLNGENHGLSLGIIAPLSPTRIALSEGPLPFSPASVKHFKALHEATEAPGLSGCRLYFNDHQVSHVAIRWGVSEQGLVKAIESHGLSAPFHDEAMPIIAGLSEGMAAPTLTLEAAYTPEPPTGFAVELGPVPTGRVLGLFGALWGEATRDALRESAKLLGQRWTHRVRLEFGTGGLECTKALLTTSDVNRADW